MIAMGDNVKQNQMLLDILERCVIQLGILVAQGQKGGPLTMQEYVQTQLDILQVVENLHVRQQEHRQFPEWREKPHMERPCRAARCKRAAQTAPAAESTVHPGIRLGRRAGEQDTPACTG